MTIFSPIPKGGGASDEPLTASHWRRDQRRQEECDAQRKPALLNAGVERAIHRRHRHVSPFTICNFENMRDPQQY